MDDTKPSRREFCTHALTVVTAGSLLHGCGGSPSSPSTTGMELPLINATVANNAVTVAIGTGSPLATVGGVALVQTSAGNFLVARPAGDSFDALTATCTHEACTVTRFRVSTYLCPCHGSEYNTSGGVVRGPAPTALRRFNTQFSDGVLTISL